MERISKTDFLNNFIKEKNIHPSRISDGYHTFEELYDHRATIYIALCRILSKLHKHHIWRSKRHSDNTKLNGWFILGINKEKGSQMTYHLPISKWKETNFAETMDCAPEWDKHTSKDVLTRMKNL